MQVLGGCYPAKAGGGTVAPGFPGGYAGGGGGAMPPEQVILAKGTTGEKARQRRIASLLTRQQLADLAGVPAEHVNLFERDLPVPLDSKRRILQQLWAKRTA